MAVIVEVSFERELIRIKDDFKKPHTQHTGGQQRSHPSRGMVQTIATSSVSIVLSGS